MHVMVAIPCFNEEKNIGLLLESLSKYNYDVYVFSCSTDKTDEIVSKHPVTLVRENNRNGKAATLNLALKYANARNYEAIIWMNGDSQPEQLENLILPLLDDKVAVTGGRPEPVNNQNGFYGWAGHLQWNIHDKLGKIAGDLMAFRTGLISEIPNNIINDDLYIQKMAEMKQQKIVYSPKATVHVKSPTTLRDMIRQRRRIYLGHIQNHLMFGSDAETVKLRHLKLAWNSMPTWNPLYFITDLIIQAYACMLAYVDYLFMKVDVKWKTVDSTKSLT